MITKYFFRPALVAITITLVSCTAGDETLQTKSNSLAGKPVKFSLFQPMSSKIILGTNDEYTNVTAGTYLLSYMWEGDEMIFVNSSAAEESSQYATYSISADDPLLEAALTLNSAEDDDNDNNIYTQSTGAIVWGESTSGYRFRALYPTTFITDFNSETYDPEKLTVNFPSQFCSIDVSNSEQWELSEGILNNDDEPYCYVSHDNGGVYYQKSTESDDLKLWTVLPINSLLFWGRTATHEDYDADDGSYLYKTEEVETVTPADEVMLSFKPISSFCIINVENAAHDEFKLKQVEVVADGKTNKDATSHQLSGTFSLNINDGTILSAQSPSESDYKTTCTFTGLSLKIGEQTTLYVPIIVADTEADATISENGIPETDIAIKVSYTEKEPDTSEEVTVTVTIPLPAEYTFLPKDSQEVTLKFLGHTVQSILSGTMTTGYEDGSVENNSSNNPIYFGGTDD